MDDSQRAIAKFYEGTGGFSVPTETKKLSSVLKFGAVVAAGALTGGTAGAVLAGVSALTPKQPKPKVSKPGAAVSVVSDAIQINSACQALLTQGRYLEYGKCVAGGAVSTTLEPLWPGTQFAPPGSPTFLAPKQGMGMFGIPSVSPVRTTRSRLVCPPGLVLGRDEQCYMRGSIPRQHRKWRPDRKPPLTVADAKAIRRAASAKRRVRRLAADVGLSTHSRGARHGAPAKGKRR